MSNATPNYSLLPSFVGPDSLVSFLGGAKALEAKAESFRPGTERWKSYLIAEIIHEAPRAIGAWLSYQMQSHVELFSIMNPRTPGDETDWDERLQDSLFGFFEPHFHFVFHNPDTREEEITNWLSHNAQDFRQLLSNTQYRDHVTLILAGHIVHGILALRDKPGQQLAMLGIVADASGWPDPLPDEVKTQHATPERQERKPQFQEALTATKAAEREDPNATVPVVAVKKAVKDAAKEEKAERRRRKKNATHIGGVHFGGPFLRQLRDDCNVPSKTLAEMWGFAAQTINNAIAADGIIVDKEDGDKLVIFLRNHQNKVQAMADAAAQTIVWSTTAFAK